MPRSVDDRWAVDSSVAVAAVDGTHQFHDVCRDRARVTRPALAGHAFFETYSVLTRQPGPARVDATTASLVLAAAFPDRCWLEPAHWSELAERVGALGLIGGSVYDAMVGESARRAGRTLLTRDKRAVRTYERIGVTFEIVGDPA